jgi:hypothetical protein
MPKKYHHFKLKIQPSPHLLSLIEIYLFNIMGSLMEQGVVDVVPTFSIGKEVVR